MQDTAPDLTPLPLGSLQAYLDQEHYAEVIAACERAIEQDPTDVAHYWVLGLAQLLQGEEEEAQLTWMAPLLNAEAEAADRLQAELLQFWLQQGAKLNRAGQFLAAAKLGEFCAAVAPYDVQVLTVVANWMQHTGETDYLLQSIPLAQTCLEQSSDPIEQLISTHLILSAAMSVCGSWQESWKYYQIHKHLLTTLADVSTSEQPINTPQLPNLLGMGAFLLYFEDQPSSNRPIRNQFAALCQNQLQQQIAATGKPYVYTDRAGHQVRPLKIGYVSECLRQHSIGWLIRWLLRYHDRDRFEVHLYSLMSSDDLVQKGFRAEYGDRFHALPAQPIAVADQINADQIDILVELDSLTSLSSCATAALKPAPVQVNWLGYDASGLPAVDYFIADPYVLPADAQTYYQEKIWRLPQTYIAVDGFEVHPPSLRREDLGIPADAIVYLSSQSGLKRNPDNIRLQMQIVRAVPQSYFVIKSWRATQERLETFFGQIADDVGLERDRLRFLAGVPSELTHRGNLSVADVVLDTYPYNGATTTLEALWTGLPIVTRVGEQFAARNSYTMMMNAGVTEGIAWSEAEYLEWGIRLGQDTHLRQQIAYRLRQSRHTSPLWNGQQFAREMETAYEQMWRRYQTGD